MTQSRLAPLKVDGKLVTDGKLKAGALKNNLNHYLLRKQTSTLSLE